MGSSDFLCSLKFRWTGTSLLITRYLDLSLGPKTWEAYDDKGDGIMVTVSEKEKEKKKNFFLVTLFHGKNFSGFKFLHNALS